jgi:hypothetical protein
MGESVVYEAITWMRDTAERVQRDRWPAELPPESDPVFWQTATRLEMRDRQVISRRIDRLIEGGKQAPLTDLESWFFGRRTEWGAQLLLAMAQRGIETEKTLPDLLRHALIGSWQTDGCIGFWTHAIERGGRPHAENPDGYTPLSS